MSQDLMSDFSRGRLHSAYQRLKLRVDQPAAKPLGNGFVRRAKGSIANDRSEYASLRRQYFSSLLKCHRDIDASVLNQLPAHARPLDAPAAAVLDDCLPPS